MHFRDEARVYVKGGDGGDGCVAFRRESRTPKGGPDGGDGGDGGSVIFRASVHCGTLSEVAVRVHWRAKSGQPGRGKQCGGKDAVDLVVDVPCGTLIYDDATGLLLRDLTSDGETVVVAKGGRGGFGNARFATATNQTPREANPGTPGEEHWLRLELKLIADVGIIGLPNAGKSTLISRLSEATPKVADYPFTTLEPVLGVVPLAGYRRLVLADLPGLIEGAHQGVGLGDRFLRHVERTRVLLHLVDAAPPGGTPRPAEAWRIVRKELAAYSAVLAAKPELVAANKMDIPEAEAGLAQLRKAVGAPVIPISGVTGKGLNDLIAAVLRLVAAQPRDPVAEAAVPVAAPLPAPPPPAEPARRARRTPPPPQAPKPRRTRAGKVGTATPKARRATAAKRGKPRR